jgi:hypothetical protein
MQASPVGPRTFDLGCWSRRPHTGEKPYQRAAGVNASWKSRDDRADLILVGCCALSLLLVSPSVGSSLMQEARHSV